ncbi:hypothetical protein GQX73_g9646 [Xylaria multiplex]|uniref:Pentatricopeptide repeat domain-containing protein n=1 Tax=Xylaria multiplex TaxID=323545 RepID=A0A7C8ILB4_9PEZI|nr:hypothetical protein GQX73_g9646 [Xylaria multiplex]
MQASWSRAAQAQSSCRYRICHHSTNALTRRSTSAASRRRVTVADVFTACYTTILGTATIVDTRRKNQRRQELDQELDRVRTSLRKFDVSRHQDFLSEANSVSDEEWSDDEKIPTYIPSQRGAEAVRPLLEELKSISNITFRPLVHQSWMEGKIEWANIETAIAYEERSPHIELQEPLTEYDLADSTATILDLVDELLRRAHKNPSRGVEDAAQSSDHARGVMVEVDALRLGYDFPSYQFPTVDPGYTKGIRTRLNLSIRRIFNQAATTRETVERICHNLLIVGVPPAIHTYNTLIAGFNRIQRPDLAQAVIDSYLDLTRWPATDQTVICMLNHYRGPGGKEGLREVVQRMRGVREDGLHLATLGGHRYGRLHREQKVPKTKRNDITFDFLVRGWLYHEEVGIACMTFVACLRNGASLPVHTLQELFHGCLATANSPNARKLLIGIDRHFENFKSYLSRIMEENTIAVVRTLLQSLHQIIKLCWLPFGEVFGETYQKHEAAATSLEAIISHVIAQLEIQEAASGSPSFLPDAVNAPESPSSHLEFAISNFNPVTLSKRTLTDSDRAYARIAMIVSIERRFGDLKERAESLAAALNATIISMETGYDIEARDTLLSDILGSPAFQKRRFAMRRALSRMDVSDNSLTVEDVASQLFRRIPSKDLILRLEENDNWKRLSIPALISFFGKDVLYSRLIPSGLLPSPEEEASAKLYKQLAEQFYACRGSIRALLFTHLSDLRQKRIMYHHDGYYSIGTRRLRSWLHMDMKYRLRGVLQTPSQFQDNSFTISFDKTAPPRQRRRVPQQLPQSQRDESASLNHPVPFKADKPTPGAENSAIEGGRAAREHEHNQVLSYFREAGLPTKGPSVR